MTYFDHQRLSQAQLFEENFKVPPAQMVIIQGERIRNQGVGEGQRIGNAQTNE